jgi:cyclopropane fatty-acyl-phospholipid synthase-like methyltransferase
MLFSAACERNKQPILEQLARWLPPAAAVLEVGSGSGQHAVHFARHLPGVRWQPTELAEHLSELAERLAQEGRSGLAAGASIAEPLQLDVTRAEQWLRGPFDALFSANTCHIMPAAAVPQLLAGAARVLGAGGLLLLYGPFRYGSEHTAASNAAFDAHLRGLDPAMGVRDARELSREAETLGLTARADQAMPANNRLLVFERQASGDAPSR